MPSLGVHHHTANRSAAATNAFRWQRPQCISLADFFTRPRPSGLLPCSVHKWLHLAAAPNRQRHACRLAMATMPSLSMEQNTFSWRRPHKASLGSSHNAFACVHKRGNQGTQLQPLRGSVRKTMLHVSHVRNQLHQHVRWQPEPEHPPACTARGPPLSGSLAGHLIALFRELYPPQKKNRKKKKEKKQKNKKQKENTYALCHFSHLLSAGDWVTGLLAE